MSRVPWLGRPTGRHAAGARGRAAPPAPVQATPPEQAPPPAAALADAPWAAASQAAAPPASAHLFGAPTMADAPPWHAEAPLVSPVTDAARAAAAASAASLPAFVPPGAAPLVTIDALGRKCPIPIIMLAQQIRDVPVGSVIAVLADDPAAYSDIPAWCGLKSHDCVFRADYATGWAFGIRRRY
jgi:tRNA 2-thiouridine synthesizing protein A